MDIPALKSATYWQPYGSLDFNTYTKQGSFFFNTTSAKTNGPTSSTSWIYLKVDQGTSDTSRIKQTAWYDGVTGVKITYVRTLNSGTWSSWYANDNDSITSISQTNSAIQSEITNRQTGDTNTLTQAKDFTSSSISNSETGMKSLITQTADGIQAQVDTKTGHDTVLSILKDNWSIGISDNTGALASGVFGDINGMTLNGNTVTIDANQTVITGTAFIKDAMIDYISASKLTVGNLDADKVRIINLDVNTLTGDVSRFLETNWDGAYGSTKITSAGMKINTQYIQADFQDFGMDFSYINQKIGGMGISQYTNGEPGLAMRLESDGAYMAWSARNEGDSTGKYINKLAWYRQGKPGLSGNYGFIFEDYVTFNRPINIEGVDQKLVYQPMNYNGSHPYFGAEGGNSGFTFGNDWIDYMNNGHYYPITRLLTSLSGLGNVAIPTQINSDGRVAGWRNITL